MTVLVDQKLNKHWKDNAVLIFILCILNVQRSVQTCQRLMDQQSSIDAYNPEASFREHQIINKRLF